MKFGPLLPKLLKK